MPPSDADRALAETVTSYWVNFAKHADPNGAGLPHWPRFEAGGLVQNLGHTVEPLANAWEPRFRFLASYRANGILPAAWRNEAL